ncbi:MAG: hypothetical protein DHS20C07_31370 [Methyloligella sp.]|nr:MAG: hypothetical protein DHS20C07_31370 [Methyloligella sp.]
MKDFENWNNLKQKLDKKPNSRFFKERDIWWCSLGINVGHEEDGKSFAFNRPVLVVKKFNHRLFWGVPLTTQIKDSRHYHQFTFKDREQSAMLTQMRLWDANRITKQMGRIGQKEFDNIKNDLLLYLK